MPLSAVEIGRQLSCSTSTVTRHTDKFKVHRDKAEEVRQRMKEALVTRNATDNERNTAEVTEDDRLGVSSGSIAKGSIAKLTKSIEKDVSSVVNKGVEYKQELAEQNEQVVNVIEQNVNEPLCLQKLQL